jgi:hypothetical protein
MKRSIFLPFIIAALGLGLWLWLRSDPQQNEALRLRQIAARELARHLSTHWPEGRILVLANPFTQRAGQPREIVAFEKAALRGLNDGWHGSPVAVVYPELRPEFHKDPASVYVDPKTTTPLSFLIAENALDQLTEANSDCDLVISLIGLPINLRQTRAWRDSEKPRFALLLPDWRMAGGTESIRQAVKSGKITVAVVNRPGVQTDKKFSSKASSTASDDFRRNFILVTHENIDYLLDNFPMLF